MGEIKLLKFYADWCQPCKILDGLLAQINSSLVHSQLKINIDIDLEQAQQFKIRGLPTLILVDENNCEIRRLSGVKPLETIKQFLTGN